MGFVFRFCNILGIVFFTITLPAWAEESPVSVRFQGIYEFTLADIPFGKMGIEVDQTEKTYAATSDIATTGIARIFVRHESHTTVDSNGRTLVYETRYQTKKKQRYVKMVKTGGRLTEEALVPPETPESRPPVEKSLKENALDPLSFVLAMREAVIRGQPDFTLNVFDGRRLTEADFTREEKKKIRLRGDVVPVIAVSVRRKLVAGFTESELKKYDPKEPTLTIYFSDDGRYVPLLLEARPWYGTLRATLAKECRTGESCLLGIKP